MSIVFKCNLNIIQFVNTIINNLIMEKKLNLKTISMIVIQLYRLQS